MNEFILYLKMGLFHVLDINAYDHILFLIVLACVYSFNQSRKVLWLITLFTIGHSITLALSAYGLLKIKSSFIEFLIPVTIFITGVMNILTAKKASLGKENQNLFFALFFGLVHGLGFSSYFKMMVGKEEDKLIPLVEFALGIELAQIIVVAAVLTFAYFFQSYLKVKKSSWILVISMATLLYIIPMLIERGSVLLK